MKIAYKQNYRRMKKMFLTTLFVSVFFISWLFAMIVILFQYKNQIKSNEALKNTMVWKMDDSCYTQFQNNMDKALFLKLKFEE